MYIETLKKNVIAYAILGRQFLSAIKAKQQNDLDFTIND